MSTCDFLAEQRSGGIVLEVIACTVEDAGNAEAGGADRLEIAQDLDKEGLTPDIEMVKRIRDAVSIPLHVMIRTRNAFTDFTAREIDGMQEVLLAFKGVGVDGAVLGFLSRNGEIDFEVMNTVLKEAQGLSVTFHRAFDLVRDYQRALMALIERTGVHRVLTSGGAASALEGKKTLAELVRRANGRIVLLAGGGVTADNLPLLVRDTGLREFHIGRGVRTPPTHAGTVDSKKVLHLASVAKNTL